MTERTTKRKPFPWRCPSCAAKAVSPVATSYSLKVKHDGRLHEIEIDEIEIPTCQSCGEKVFGGDADEAISRALRLKLNLLSPEQIRARLRELGVSQKEVASELGVAEATISRWATGSVVQSRALDRFLRTYLAFPEVRKMLREKVQDARFGLTSIEAEDRETVPIDQSK